MKTIKICDHHHSISLMWRMQRRRMIKYLQIKKLHDYLDKLQSFQPFKPASMSFLVVFFLLLPYDCIITSSIHHHPTSIHDCTSSFFTLIRLIDHRQTDYTHKDISLFCLVTSRSSCPFIDSFQSAQNATSSTMSIPAKGRKKNTKKVTSR